MALLTMAQVNDRAAMLLDDPGHRRFSSNYLRGHIDQQNESMMLDLESLGIQQQEATAIFNIPANTTDLTPYFADGQPLAAFLRPVEIDWKLQGQADTGYEPCYPTKELQDVNPANVGAQQYKWSGGVLHITTSSVALTLRVQYLALTSTISDGNAKVMRGVGFLLASMTAQYVASLNNAMGTLQQRLDKQVPRDRKRLKGLLVQAQQGQLIVPRGIRRTTTPTIAAGGAAYV